MEELMQLPNIGKEVARQLVEVGIKDVDTLKRLGSKEAWLKIKAVDASACIHRLYGLQGAIDGVKKVDLSKEIKQDLKDFYNFHK